MLCCICVVSQQRMCTKKDQFRPPDLLHLSACCTSWFRSNPCRHTLRERCWASWLSGTSIQEGKAKAWDVDPAANFSKAGHTLISYSPVCGAPLLDRSRLFNWLVSKGHVGKFTHQWPAADHLVFCGWRNLFVQWAEWKKKTKPYGFSE